MRSTTRLRRIFLLFSACTLAVFGALVFGLTANVRARLRRAAERRDADMLHDVALMQISTMQARLESLGVKLSTPDVFAAVLESSRLRGDLAVLGVQLFDADGVVREAIPALSDQRNHPAPWWPTPLTTPIARYNPRGSLEAMLGAPVESSAPTTPLLEVVVPLRPEHGGSSFGNARYWIDGRGLAADFAAIDRSLIVQSGVAFLGGGILLAILMVWTYRRLAQANEQLLAQTADLARANEELDFAAKIGALGAISAHLIHGLKNPLAGLEGYVAEAAEPGDLNGSGEARQTAMDTARRLRTLVNDVVAVLRDETAGEGDHAVPLAEAAEAIVTRAAAPAAAAGVKLITTVQEGSALQGRTASLAGLILANLLANAIEASSRGGEVRFEAVATPTGIAFSVTDSGPGLPEPVRNTLFRPVRSSKPGGGGMGLAISHRLARHAGGELSLVRSDAHGTVFRLVVPAR